MIKPDLQIAFITGRSRADNCSLSPAQATFIQQVVGHHQHVSFALRYRQQALEMLASASHTLLLSGSCGLELFNQLHLPPEWLARVSVLLLDRWRAADRIAITCWYKAIRTGFLVAGFAGQTNALPAAI